MRIRITVLTATLALLFAGGVIVADVPVPANFRVSGLLPGLQNEEQTWICPKDTTNILTIYRDLQTGHRQVSIGRSLSNGVIWFNLPIGPSLRVYNYQSDPAMTVNSSGDIIVCFMDLENEIGSLSEYNTITFLVSEDCGASWLGPYPMTDGEYFEDKEFIACDRTGGPHDGNIYVSWTRAITEPEYDFPVMFTRSTDRAQTFEPPQVIAPTPESEPFAMYSSFSQPLVGRDGAVYVFYRGRYFNTSADEWLPAIEVVKSIDAGVTWGPQITLFPVDVFDYVDGSINVYSAPVSDADITSGLHAGNIYVQWIDKRDSAPYDCELYFSRSLDTGHTWSPPIRINDDPLDEDIDQFLNWMICNDEGVLVSIWYDQRLDPAHYMFDVFAGYSYDGGETWTSNHRISSVSSSPDLLVAAVEHEGMLTKPMAGKIAEYIGLSSIGDIVAATWTDTRDAISPGDQEVWSARWHLPLTDPRLLRPIGGEAIDTLNPDFSWATAWKDWEDRYRLQIDDDPAFSGPIIDVSLTENGYNEPLSGYPDGKYYWRVKAYKAPGGLDTDSTAFCAPDSFLVMSCDCGFWGDVDDNDAVNPVDVVYMVNFVYKNQDARIPPPNCPYEVGDVDCSGQVNPVDVVYFVNYVYKNQDAFCEPCVD